MSTDVLNVGSGELNVTMSDVKTRVCTCFLYTLLT